MDGVAAKHFRRIAQAEASGTPQRKHVQERSLYVGKTTILDHIFYCLISDNIFPFVPNGL